jgi:predicted MFS family arabinose efflux permease
MSPSKTLFFFLELLNCWAAVYYSNFLFFYMKCRFGFGELENLLLAAFNGVIYIVAAWHGGRFAQKFGYVKSMAVGSCGVALTLVAGLFMTTATGQVVVFGFWTIFICFFWPALEALVSERSGDRLPDMVGMYNVTFAAGGAVAYFTTGILLGRLGMQSLFWLPLCLHVIQLVLLPVAAKLRKRERLNGAEEPCASGGENRSHSKRFLHMAWLANPLSYVAINTVIPLIPSIAGRLGLSTALAGVCCSAWMFARLGAFALLWRWTGWHYRFRWLAGAFALLVLSFVILIHPASVAVLLAAEICFGLSAGLIYYSSLYYSMNASEERGAHGGLHEAMIGVGLFIGPACGASALYFAPGLSNSSVWSVGGVLVAGCSGILWMGRSRMRAWRRRNDADGGATDRA